MKKRLLRIVKILVGLYLVLCCILYFFQEKIIFFPQKIDKNYTFDFGQKWEEVNIKSFDGKLLNGVLFKSDNSKGVIFYLHGNAGSLLTWGDVAKTYTDLNYDVFILDYRSYGKSEGKITSQEQLFHDSQTVYDNLKTKYSEDKIIVLGYSIGTGLAAQVAANNHPKLLILQAPYYSLTDMMIHRYPFVPTFLLKYKFATNEYLSNCKIPLVIFHGNQDKVIYYGSSLKLKKEFKQGDRLITLNGQNHNGMTDNIDYKKEIKKILSK